jgi:hypothetical protein
VNERQVGGLIVGVLDERQGNAPSENKTGARPEGALESMFQGLDTACDEQHFMPNSIVALLGLGLATQRSTTANCCCFPCCFRCLRCFPCCFTRATQRLGVSVVSRVVFVDHLITTPMGHWANYSCVPRIPVSSEMQLHKSNWPACLLMRRPVLRPRHRASTSCLLQRRFPAFVY